MRAISLQSGSNGNCIYVETARTKLLLDAGISGVRAQRYLADCGVDIRDVDAVIISHDHSDHIRCAGVYQRKFGLPIYVTSRTLQAGLRRCNLGRLADVRNFRPRDAISFDGATVETFPTPHDGADGIAFVIFADGKRLGVLTDLGHAFDELAEVIASLDAVILESNYDTRMLDTGRYPEFLKARIRGSGGHLSNAESADLLAVAGGDLKWACLAHLSEENNAPDIAMAAHRKTLGRTFSLHVAPRYGPSEVLEV